MRDLYFNPLYLPAMPFENRKKNILESFFSLVLSQLKKYHPSGNLKFNNLDIFQSLRIPILMGKVLPISLKLKFKISKAIVKTVIFLSTAEKSV